MAPCSCLQPVKLGNTDRNPRLSIFLQERRAKSHQWRSYGMPTESTLVLTLLIRERIQMLALHIDMAFNISQLHDHLVSDKFPTSLDYFCGCPEGASLCQCAFLRLLFFFFCIPTLISWRSFSSSLVFPFLDHFCHLPVAALGSKKSRAERHQVADEREMPPVRL